MGYNYLLHTPRHKRATIQYTLSCGKQMSATRLRRDNAELRDEISDCKNTAAEFEIVATILTCSRMNFKPGSGDAKYSRKVSQENSADPGRRAVRPRCAEVPVDDDDRDENGQNVHDESEQEVLGDKRNVVRCRRKNLGDQQQEHDQREQD